MSSALKISDDILQFLQVKSAGSSPQHNYEDQNEDCENYDNEGQVDYNSPTDANNEDENNKKKNGS